MRSFLQFISLPIAFLYWGLTSLRNRLFDRAVIKVNLFSKPVISVGNITMGGTGKTPVVIALAEQFRNEGINVGIVSRGYGRSSKGQVIVHDGVHIRADVKSGGDEPVLMAGLLANIPIIVDSDRSAGVRRMIRDFPIDVVLLDDAFQHRRAYRDLDIVVINSQAQSSQYRMLPWGRLRESMPGLHRAHLVLYTKCRDLNPPEIHSTITSYTDAPVVCVRTTASIMKHTEDGLQPAGDPPGKMVGICGIGDPDSFTDLVHRSGVELYRFKALADHQDYTPSQIQKLSKWIDASACRNIITTEKDFVKLPDEFLALYSIYVIRIAAVFPSDKTSVITNMVHEIIQSKKGK